MASNHLVIDHDTFAERYPHRPFAVRHNLGSHPLFEISRLLELQKALPPDKSEFYNGQVGVNEDRRLIPPTGLTAEETIRQIRECKSWLVLKNVELDPTYRDLVMQCIEELRPVVAHKSPGMRRYQGWIFITSPGSIAPYHLDPEHNFLLQIRGPKMVHVFDPNDRSLLSENELEAYYNSGAAKGKLEFREEYAKKDQAFAMGAGDGVYIPVSAPHWVKVEDDYSISFSITYYCDEVYRRDRLYRFNVGLRRLGLTPTPYGRSPWRDGLKDSLISTYLKVRGLVGRKTGDEPL